LLLDALELIARAVNERVGLDSGLDARGLERFPERRLAAYAEGEQLQLVQLVVRLVPADARRPSSTP
jgi:hypothetical protein